MRKVFVEELTTLAKRNKKIVLLTADLGFMVLEPFKKLLPKQFYNVGVMEQNMVGVATGLAMNGYIPFIYSITTFITLRAFEFIRNGPAAHHLPVRIIGIGSGVEYSHDGLSHHAYDDLGVMRMLPNLSIIAPADNVQTRIALRETWNRPEPVYYRLSKNESEDVPNLRGRYAFNRLNVVGRGEDCVLFATGTMALQACKAAQELEKQHITCTVAVISTIQPIATSQIANLLSTHRLAVTIEAHYPTGGIGTVVSEIHSELPTQARLLRLGLRYTPKQKLGDLDYYYRKNGLTVNAIVRTVVKNLPKRSFTSFVRRFF